MGHGFPSQPGQEVVGRQHRHGAPRGIRGTPDVRQNHCRGQEGLLARFLPSLTSYSLLQGSSHEGATWVLHQPLLHQELTSDMEHETKSSATEDWKRHLING